MKYGRIEHGIFISRPNRFIAYVDINGKTETVHVKNTGRCKELLLPGVKVILERSDNPARKTAYDLIAVYKKGLGLVNIDSQAPNKVVYEWLSGDRSILGHPDYIKPEYTIGCTLEINGMGYFPDAPTVRGVKHLNELAMLSKEGYECYIAFAIQMNGIKEVKPNIDTHREFGEALDKAVKAGVKVLYLQCDVKEDELNII